jgi:hypothetical protein
MLIGSTSGTSRACILIQVRRILGCAIRKVMFWVMPLQPRGFGMLLIRCHPLHQIEQHSVWVRVPMSFRCVVCALSDLQMPRDCKVEFVVGVWSVGLCRVSPFECHFSSVSRIFAASGFDIGRTASVCGSLMSIHAGSSSPKRLDS